MLNKLSAAFGWAFLGMFDENSKPTNFSLSEVRDGLPGALLYWICQHSACHTQLPLQYETAPPTAPLL
jgi:hypothetical protein